MLRIAQIGKPYTPPGGTPGGPRYPSLDTYSTNRSYQLARIDNAFESMLARKHKGASDPAVNMSLEKRLEALHRDSDSDAKSKMSGQEQRDLNKIDILRSITASIFDMNGKAPSLTFNVLGLDGDYMQSQTEELEYPRRKQYVDMGGEPYVGNPTGEPLGSEGAWQQLQHMKTWYTNGIGNGLLEGEIRYVGDDKQHLPIETVLDAEEGKKQNSQADDPQATIDQHANFINDVIGKLLEDENLDMTLEERIELERKKKQPQKDLRMQNLHGMEDVGYSTFRDPAGDKSPQAYPDGTNSAFGQESGTFFTGGRFQ